MATSYKPVLLTALLDHVDEQGKARLEDVVHAFHEFCLGRQRQGPVVERSSARMAQADQLSPADVRTIMLGMPFGKFERRQYLRYDQRDLAFLRFHPTLWRQLQAEDLGSIRQACAEAIGRYYGRIGEP